MARLEPAEKSAWKESLRACGSPWVVFGIHAESNITEKVDGMAGLIDWHVHGQVSSLLARNLLGKGEFCIIAGAHGKPSFLLYHFGNGPDPKAVSSRLKNLKLQDVCLAESTFPEDFLSKLKQNCKKEGIRCTKLESVPE